MLGPLVSAYLFCAGAGAGGCFVLATMGLAVPREEVRAARPGPRGKLGAYAFAAPKPYRRMFGPAYLVSLLALALGALFLLGDAGTLAAPVLLAANPTPTFLSVGSFLLFAGILLGAFLCFCWSSPRPRVGYRTMRIAQWAMLVIGFGISVYTGLLLSSMPAVPIWSTPWLPVLFVVSSLSCGSALVMSSNVATGSTQVFRGLTMRLMGVDVAIMAVEAAVVVAFLMAACSNSYGVAAQGYASLMAGSLQGLFLLGFVGVGLTMPIAVESVLAVRRQLARGPLLVAATAVLIGGFILRYCVVAVGLHPEVWTVIT